MLSRLRGSCVLYQMPERKKNPGRGRPPKYGERLPDVKSLAAKMRDRARTEKLFASFDRSGNPVLDAAWANEVDHRFAAYDRGEIEASSVEDVFVRINQR